MAQYRLSVNVISRSAGRSATGAAAYRAAERIVDQQTGDVHNYTRKDGVTHSEILAPDNAPDWMHDRAQLFNGIEAAERRLDAQLCREIQLSLPHELSHDDRVSLARKFVQEQCVSRGMIADLCIHEPNPDGDERNHHAHVLLTMRELAGQGFGKKARDWNSREVVQEWRAEWANMQNQMLEERNVRHNGELVQVSHESYQDRGILKEPQQHMGPIATEIERSGRQSHIANDNRETQRVNAVYADLEKSGNLIDAKILFEKRKFEAWATAKRDLQEQANREEMGRFNVNLAMRMAAFENQLDAEFGETKEQVSQAQDQVSQRLDATGWRKFVRDITFTTRRDRRALERLEQEAATVKAEEDQKRALQAQADADKRNALLNDLQTRSQMLEKGIHKAQERREAQNWAMGPGKGVKAPQGPENPTQEQTRIYNERTAQDSILSEEQKARKAALPREFDQQTQPEEAYYQLAKERDYTKEDFNKAADVPEKPEAQSDSGASDTKSPTPQEKLSEYYRLKAQAPEPINEQDNSQDQNQ